MNKPRLSFLAQADRYSLDDDAARARNILHMGLILFVASGTVIPFNIYMLSRSPAWQLWLAQCTVTIFGLVALFAIWLSRRGRLNLSGAILIADLMSVILVYTALIAGVGLPLGLVGLVVLIVLSSMILPARWLTWATIAGILTTVAAGLLDLLGLPFQVTLPAIVIYIYPVAGIALLILSIIVVRQFQSYRLASKLTIVLIAITLISVGTIAILNNLTSTAVLTQTSGSNFASSAESLAANTANQLSRQVDLLRGLSLDQSLQVKLEIANSGYSGTPEEILARLTQLDQQWRAADAAQNDADPLVQSKMLDPISTLLRAFSQSFPGNVEVFATDQYGALAATTNRTSDYYQADESWWQAAWNAGQGAIYIGQPEFDASSSSFSINIAIPIYDQVDALGTTALGTTALYPTPRPVGVLRTTYRVTKLLDQINSAKFGKTGQAELYLSEGRKIAGTGQEAVAVDSTILNQLEAARNSTYALVTYDAAPSLVSQASVAAGTTDPDKAQAIANLGWKIVVHQDSRESLSIVQTQTRNTLLLALIIASVVAFAGLGIAQVLAQPLVTLTDIVQKVAGGDLSIQMQVKTTDEIGALARTFNTMTTQLRELVGSLETRVEARTAQLRASAQVARAATSILEPQSLLQQTVDLICDRFGYYYAGIFLLDDENHFAILHAGHGEPGRSMIERGHKFDAKEARQSMVGWVCVNKQPRIALDVGSEAVRFANPLLPDTRSEVALPLQAGDRILGVLDVQSAQAAAFDETNIATLQSMADQIAVALENARLFSQTQKSLAENKGLVAQIQASLQETTALYQLGQVISMAPDTSSVFQAIVEYGLQPEIELALLVLFEEFTTPMPQRLEVSQLWTRVGSGADTRLQAGTHFDFERFPLRALLTNDPAGVVLRHQDADPGLQSLLTGLDILACVPLRVGTRWIGALGLGGAPRAESASPDPYPLRVPWGPGALGAWLRRYQSIASQAAVAIDNQRLYQNAQASLQELSTLYRAVTREAWSRALENKPHLSEFEYPLRPTGEFPFGPHPTLRARMPSRGTPSNGDAARLDLPLTLRGQEIGMVELTSNNTAAWTTQERALVEAILTQTALALDSARLFDETQRLAGRERLINEITARIRASTSVSGILLTAARELAQAMNVPHAVARINPPTDQTENKAS